MAKLSETAELIAKQRYFMEGENWEECVKRVSRVISSIESNSKYYDLFGDIIYNMYFIPAGRILRNAGRPRGSLFNCYHIPIGDSREEIGQAMKDALILWGEGGGVGINYSPLRPRGDSIKGVGGTSSGLVSFIDAMDAIAKTIESGGSRRAAALACVDVAHPEVVNFIDAKIEQGKLSHFNISVIINEQFLETVELDEQWTFKFNQKEYEKVSARNLWDLIINNMIRCAEPGLINWTNFSRNNSYYYDPVLGPNPCGEATLSAYDVCDLGSLVLPNFVSQGGNTNWKNLEDAIKLAVRFLDNVIDVNKYTLDQNKVKAQNSRRIGLGVMGLAEYLFIKKIRYGSPKAIFEVEKLMRFIRDVAYQTLIELAVEKGSFPKFDPILYSKADFIRSLPASIRKEIKQKGSRCVTCMSIAPTGTISLLCEVTSSIEPLYSKAYKRKDRVSERVYIHHLYEKLVNENNNEVPSWYVDSYDLKPEDHLEIQIAVQKYVDGAVSKTINLPNNITKEQLSSLILEYIRDLKGVTVYVDGSRNEQVYYRLDNNEVKEYIMSKNKKQFITNEMENTSVCASGKCDLT